MATDIPIYDGKRTVGAFDFLIQTPDDILHLEVACQILPVFGELSRLGELDRPEQKGSFGKETDKDERQATALLLTPLGQKMPKGASITLSYKGCRYHQGEFFFNIGAVKILFQCHVTVDGIWMFCEDFVGIYRDCHKNCRFVERIRPDWLAPLQLARSK